MGRSKRPTQIGDAEPRTYVRIVTDVISIIQTNEIEVPNRIKNGNSADPEQDGDENRFVDTSLDKGAHSITGHIELNPTIPDLGSQPLRLPRLFLRQRGRASLGVPVHQKPVSERIRNGFLELALRSADYARGRR